MYTGTRKTVEGTLMSVFSQFIVAAVIVFLGIGYYSTPSCIYIINQCFIVSDQDLPSLTQKDWVIVGVAIVSGGAMEAYTHQVDNLVLGAFVFSILIAFL